MLLRLGEIELRRASLYWWCLAVFFFFLKGTLFIYLWLCWVFVSVRGLSLVVASGGPLFIAVHGPLTVAASLVAEHKLQTCRLSSCGSRAQLLRGMWDLPGPGLEPVCPALAGRFSTTAPPGKPCLAVFIVNWESSLMREDAIPYIKLLQSRESSVQ